mmetsp:Transcript_18962/g.39975  ORF Transcript_18962/g.39975 Transcript_18962/m.39975 type:complete len:269 (-) Transcript_18962:373-1179(-)
MVWDGTVGSLWYVRVPSRCEQDVPCAECRLLLLMPSLLLLLRRIRGGIRRYFYKHTTAIIIITITVTVTLDQTSHTLQSQHTRIDHVPVVYAIQSFDVGVSRSLYKSPIEADGARFVSRKAVMMHFVKCFGDGGGVVHDLLRHATDIHARPTQPSLLHHGHPRSVRCRASRRRDAARSCPDDEQVKVVVTILILFIGCIISDGSRRVRIERCLECAPQKRWSDSLHWHIAQGCIGGGGVIVLLSIVIIVSTELTLFYPTITRTTGTAL